jgi:tetratricopeptide (TPR) repeat protein
MFFPLLTPRQPTPATPDERACRAISISQHHRLRGLHDEAAAELSEFWGGLGSEPNVEGLCAATCADLFNLLGVLSRELTRRSRGKDYSHAVRLFAHSFALSVKLNDVDRQADALSQLGWLFAQTGEGVRAGALLNRAASLSPRDPEVLARVWMHLIYLEVYAQRFDAALRLASVSADLFDERVLVNHTLIGNYLSARGIARLSLHDATSDPDDLDRAFIDMEAARHNYQIAGHKAYEASVLNNSAFFHMKAGDLPKALESAERARALMEAAGDAVLLAQVDDTLARIHLAAGRYDEARTCAVRAADVFARTNSAHLLEESRAVLSQISEHHGGALPPLFRRTHLRVVQPNEQPAPSNAILSNSPGTHTMFCLELSQDDRSLASCGYHPGDVLNFTSDTSPQEGELVAAYHLREESYYVGFYHADPSCLCHLDADDRPQAIISLHYPHDPPRQFPAGELTILGVHSFLRGRIH